MRWNTTFEGIQMIFFASQVFRMATLLADQKTIPFVYGILTKTSVYESLQDIETE